MHAGTDTNSHCEAVAATRGQGWCAPTWPPHRCCSSPIVLTACRRVGGLLACGGGAGGVDACACQGGVHLLHSPRVTVHDRPSGSLPPDDVHCALRQEPRPRGGSPPPTSFFCHPPDQPFCCADRAMLSVVLHKPHCSLSVLHSWMPTLTRRSHRVRRPPPCVYLCMIA